MIIAEPIHIITSFVSIFTIISFSLYFPFYNISLFFHLLFFSPFYRQYRRKNVENFLSHGFLDNKFFNSGFATCPLGC